MASQCCLDEQGIDRRPTPPLRKSIFQHPMAKTWHVNVTAYDCEWPSQFKEISNHLHGLFVSSRPPAVYQRIEHIGSTSIPGLAAKPNIDILVTFDNRTDYNNAIEALHWEVPKSRPFTRYTQIPDGGGIAGRESFKIYLPEYHPNYTTTPERNLYLICDTEDNPIGRTQIRCYRTVKNVLLQSINEDLLHEYAEVKLSLGRKVFLSGLDYTPEKDDIVRKILLRGGWTDVEVDELRRLSGRKFRFEEEESY